MILSWFAPFAVMISAVVALAQTPQGLDEKDREKLKGLASQIRITDSNLPAPAKNGNWLSARLAYFGPFRKAIPSNVQGLIAVHPRFASGLWAFDLGASHFYTTWQDLYTRPGQAEVGQAPADSPSLTDSNANMHQFRFRNDRWRALVFEVGASIQARFFHDFLPLLSHRARISIGTGDFHEARLMRRYRGYLFTTEASVNYQLGRNSNWAIEGGIGSTWGWLWRDEGPGRSFGRLPLQFLTGKLGLVVWF